MGAYHGRICWRWRLNPAGANQPCDTYCSSQYEHAYSRVPRRVGLQRSRSAHWPRRQRALIRCDHTTRRLCVPVKVVNQHVQSCMIVTTALLYATIVVGARSETELLEWIVETATTRPTARPSRLLLLEMSRHHSPVQGFPAHAPARCSRSPLAPSVAAQASQLLGWR